MPLATARVRARAVPVSVAVDAERGDEADALLVAATHLGAQHAGRDHADVARRVEAVERERVAARHDDERVGARRDRQRRDDVVGDEDAEHVELRCRVELGGGEPVGGGTLTRLVGAHADGHVDAGVAQVQRPGAALVAVADDGDSGAPDRVEGGIGVVDDRGHVSSRRRRRPRIVRNRPTSQSRHHPGVFAGLDKPKDRRDTDRTG